MGHRPTAEETALPGVGTKYTVGTEAGRLVSIVVKRDGGRVLAIHHLDDPDACGMTIKLTDAEAELLADVLLRAET